MSRLEEDSTISTGLKENMTIKLGFLLNFGCTILKKEKGLFALVNNQIFGAAIIINKTTVS